MELDLIEIISLLTVFTSLILAAFLISMKSVNYKSNLLLALFLLVNAQDSDSIFLSHFIYPTVPWLGMLINSTVLLKIPLFYLYILSVIYSDFKLNWKHVLHAIPFLIVNIILIPRFYAQDFTGQIAYLESNTLSHRQPEIVFDYLLLHVQVFVYLVACYYSINRYRKLLLENFSDASLFNYNWLFQLVTVFAVDTILASIKNLFMFMEIMDAYYYTLLSTSLLVLGYIIWIVFRMMQHPELFRGIDSGIQLVKNMVNEMGVREPLNHGTGLNGEEVDEKVIHLNEYMAESEPFLDPTLTIYNLSIQTNIPVRDLSLLINHDLNQHFFDFVNSFRIQKAMEILKNPGKKDLTVLEILYEVGFNSKSSFNTAFKKYTDFTPTEYRKKHLKTAS